MAYSLFRNFSLKVLAVGIAVLLWMNVAGDRVVERGLAVPCLLYTSPSPRDGLLSRMPSSA